MNLGEDYCQPANVSAKMVTGIGSSDKEEFCIEVLHIQALFSHMNIELILSALIYIQNGSGFGNW